jgi:Peptidase A4 family
MRENLIKSNHSGVYFVKPPPDGFDPRTANIDELYHWGYPLPPSKHDAPDAWEIWSRAVRSSKRRVTPTIVPRKRTTVLRKRRLPDRDATLNDLSWSGVAVTAAQATDVAPFQTVAAEWKVPVAIAPAGLGNAGEYSQSATWVGIDGFLSGSIVIQAGTEQDVVFDSANRPTPNYYFWFEWYPEYAASVQNFSVNHGDEVFVSAAWRALEPGAGSGPPLKPSTGPATYIASFGFINITTGAAVSVLCPTRRRPNHRAFPTRTAGTRSGSSKIPIHTTEDRRRNL